MTAPTKIPPAQSTTKSATGANQTVGAADNETSNVILKATTAVASLKRLSPSRMVASSSFPRSDRKIAMTATGSVAAMIGPNSQAADGEKGAPHTTTSLATSMPIKTPAVAKSVTGSQFLLKTDSGNVQQPAKSNAGKKTNITRSGVRLNSARRGSRPMSSPAITSPTVYGTRA